MDMKSSLNFGRIQTTNFEPISCSSPYPRLSHSKGLELVSMFSFPPPQVKQMGGILPAAHVQAVALQRNVIRVSRWSFAARTISRLKRKLHICMD
jgi:hypothetical protein